MVQLAEMEKLHDQVQKELEDTKALSQSTFERVQKGTCPNAFVIDCREETAEESSEKKRHRSR